VGTTDHKSCQTHVCIKYTKSCQAHVGTKSQAQQTTKVSWISYLPGRQFKSTTGIERPIFELLLKRIGSKLSDVYKLTRALQLELFLVVIKLNLSFQTVSGMFSVSDRTASSTFYKVLDLVKK